MMLLRNKIVALLPTLLMMAYAGYTFFNTGLPAGPDNWKFWASLIGFVCFASMGLLFVWKMSKHRDRA